MALTRNTLKEMGLDEEQINTIIDGHAETVNALIAERDGYKEQAEAAVEVTAERDSLREQLAAATEEAARVQTDYDAYKQQVEGEQLLTAKRAALIAAAEKAGVTREAFLAAIVKAWDMATLELDESGAIKDEEGVAAIIQRDYADFIATSGSDPVPPVDPPTSGKTSYTAADIDGMTIEEINKNWESIAPALSTLK